MMSRLSTSMIIRQNQFHDDQDENAVLNCTSPIAVGVKQSNIESLFDYGSYYSTSVSTSYSACQTEASASYEDNYSDTASEDEDSTVGCSCISEESSDFSCSSEEGGDAPQANDIDSLSNDGNYSSTDVSASYSACQTETSKSYDTMFSVSASSSKDSVFNGICISEENDNILRTRSEESGDDICSISEEDQAEIVTAEAIADDVCQLRSSKDENQSEDSIDDIAKFRAGSDDAEDDLENAGFQFILELQQHQLSIASPSQRLPTIMEVESTDTDIKLSHFGIESVEEEYIEKEDDLSFFYGSCDESEVSHVQHPASFDSFLDGIYNDLCAEKEVVDVVSTEVVKSDNDCSLVVEADGIELLLHSMKIKCDASDTTLEPNEEAPEHTELQARLAAEKATADQQTRELNQQIMVTQNYTDEFKPSWKQIQEEVAGLTTYNEYLQRDIFNLVASKRHMEEAKARMKQEEAEVAILRDRHARQLVELEDEKERLNEAMEEAATDTTETKELARKVLSELQEIKLKLEVEMADELKREQEKIIQLQEEHEQHMNELMEEHDNLTTEVAQETEEVETMIREMESALESIYEHKENMENELTLRIDAVNQSTTDSKRELQMELGKARFSKTRKSLDAFSEHCRESLKCALESNGAIDNVAAFTKVAVQAITEPFTDDVLIETAVRARSPRRNS
ncbi:predicted protein [Thalassiosira pseudonana CCMP1335]|uniref:Uncharacterized protein n=1 Tax=Thalassiosira pseudonana TaxID=35128 RepID=B8C2T7_THAPS|nr:predicted protein [Thalassiosira pseudonana CCMP1335]EED92442.1 predicted protein [Thalassiosira pseudonana CCMP1335]